MAKPSLVPLVLEPGSVTVSVNPTDARVVLRDEEVRDAVREEVIDELDVCFEESVEDSIIDAGGVVTDSYKVEKGSKVVVLMVVSNVIVVSGSRARALASETVSYTTW